jgi:hypothetical protein
MPFVKDGDCPPGATVLAPFNTRYVAANIREPESGTEFSAEITLCTEEGLEGECATEVVAFLFGDGSGEGAGQPAGDPEFALAFVEIRPCAGRPYFAAFQVENASEYTFESVRWMIEDVTHEKTVYAGNNNRGFVEAGGCPPGASILPPGTVAEVAANIGSPEPGTSFEATIKLCTQDGLEGDCVSQMVAFTFEE